MLKVTIITTYSLKNKGDELLLRGTIELFQKLFVKPCFYIFSLEPASDMENFKQNSMEYIIQIPLPFHMYSLYKYILYNGLTCISVLIYKITKIERIFTILPKEINKSINCILKSNYVIARSSDMLTDSYGILTFFKNITQIWFAKLLNKRVLIHAHSIYINKKGITGFLLKKLLRLTFDDKVDVTVRDEYSSKFLSSIGVKSKLIPPPSIIISRKYTNYHKKKGKEIVLIPRARFGSKNYFIELINFLKSKGFRIIFLGQSFENKYADNDISAIKEIIKKINGNIITKNQTDLNEYLKSISNAKIVISERAIALFTALSMGIPSIGIDVYKGKTEGVMNLFKMENFCASQENLTSEMLVDIFNKIWSSYEEIQSKLDQKSDELYKNCINLTRSLVDIKG